MCIHKLLPAKDSKALHTQQILHFTGHFAKNNKVRRKQGLLPIIAI